MADFEGDQRLHDIMDKMDDLGFAVAAVDGIQTAIKAADAMKEKSEFSKVAVQLLADLAAFAHGALRSPQASVQQELFEALKAEGFPHSTLLSQGAAFLDTVDGRILALDYLLGEVMAAKMLALARYKQKQQQQQQTTGVQGILATTASSSASSSSAMEDESKSSGPAAKSSSHAKKRGGGDEDASNESKRPRGSPESASAASAACAMEDVAPASSVENDSEELTDELRLIAHALQFVLNAAAVSPAPLNGASALRLVRARLQSWLSASPKHALVASLPPLFQRSDFSSKQLAVLNDMFRTFVADYTLRVHVMRKRLEVTLQSFMWSDKGKAHEEELSRLAASKLATFPSRAQVDDYELWSATAAVLHIARMTSREYAQRSSIKRVIIGQVPDRGGRVDTNTRLPGDYAEMPAFATRSTEGADSHRRGGGGGGRGGRGGKKW